MDLKQIEKLMALMGRHGVRRLAIKEEGVDLELEREGLVQSQQPQSYYSFPPAYYPSTPLEEEKKEESRASGKEEGGRYITSPMVGTYYMCAAPDAPAFVKVGDEVREDSVVCIIEAMKVMNEIKAGVSGVVKEILVKNGSPVEFGTKIIRVI